MAENSSFGILFAIGASIFWSITVTILKPVTQNISPFLINPIKNSIGFILFFILFISTSTPLWYSHLYNYEYAIILISGALGMVLGDTVFIYALNKIGANRVAIVDSFSPVVIHIYSIILLSNQELSIMQISGFFITIAGLLILTYENDYDDIDYKTKRFGIALVLGAMACTGGGVVFLKTVLERIAEPGLDGIKLNLWVTAFRLIPGVVLSWIIFSFQKDRHQLLKPLKDKNNYRPLIIASILGPFLALGCWILGYAFLSKPSVASIIGQTSVIFIVILSWLFLKEKITRLRILSTIFVFVGVILAAINS
tara:strand:- start:173 stop:1105 length:933 start_codon:yes stop_codon:yes gene_type:complete